MISLRNIVKTAGIAGIAAVLFASVCVPAEESFPAEQTGGIENGYYVIASAINDAALLHVAGGSLEDNAQMEIWNDQDLANEVYYVERQENGLYKIINSVNQKALSVRDGSPESGVELVQRTYDASENQQWSIQRTEDGHYTVASVYGTVIDCAGGNASDGNRILLCSNNGGINQKWDFFRNGIWQDGRIRTGYYTIASGVDLEKRLSPMNGSLENGTQIVIWDSQMGEYEQFHIQQEDTGVFRITNAVSGRVLGTKDASTESGAKLEIKDFDGTPAQLWMFDATDDGYFCIHSLLGTYMDLAESNTANGAEVLLCSFNGNANQQWVLLPNGLRIGDIGLSAADNEAAAATAELNVSAVAVPIQVESGLYVIASAMDSNKALHIAGDSNDSYATLEILDYTGSPYQIFFIGANGDGTYRITSDADGGKSLDVKDASPEAGAGLQMREFDGTIGQTWTIQPTSDGLHYVICSLLGTSLDCFEARSENYTPVTMYTMTESINQRWSLVRVG